MFGAILRNGLAVGVGVLAGAFLSRVLGYMLPLMGPTDGLFYRTFAGISEHSLLVMLVSCGIALFASASVEGGFGV